MWDEFSQVLKAEGTGKVLYVVTDRKWSDLQHEDLQE